MYLVGYNIIRYIKYLMNLKKKILLVTGESINQRDAEKETTKQTQKKVFKFQNPEKLQKAVSYIFKSLRLT
jgi:hypothetical protein